jgi:hypothetical protein
MNKYTTILLSDILEELGEEKAKSILSNYLCPLNEDIETFLVRKAIDFNKKSISSTHLVFSQLESGVILVGYFTLTLKCTSIPIKNISKTFEKTLLRFGLRLDGDSHIQIALPLIAQFGKNYANNYNELISGEELMKIVIDKIRQAQLILGGKLVF